MALHIIPKVRTPTKRIIGGNGRFNLHAMLAHALAAHEP